MKKKIVISHKMKKITEIRLLKDFNGRKVFEYSEIR